VLYERSRPGAAPPPPVHPRVPDPLVRISTDPRACLVVRAAPERPQPSTPDYDALAAEVIHEGLHERGVDLNLVCAGNPEPVLTPVDRDLVVVGGPGSQRPRVLLQGCLVIWYKDQFAVDPRSLETGHERSLPL
jgi:hypothetical protein